MHKLVCSLMIVAVLAGWSGAAPAALIFTDRTSWEAAVDSFTTEVFDTEFNNSYSVTFDSGITSDVVGSLLANFVNTASEFNGAVNDFFAQLLWRLPQSTVAFGGYFRSVDSDGLKVAANFDGLGVETIDIASIFSGGTGETCTQCYTGFFGVVSESKFDSIYWLSGNGEETFQIDDFSFAIPTPTNLALFSIGLAGLGWSRRKKV